MNPPPGILALPNGQWILEQDTHLSRWAEQHGTIVTDPHLFKFLAPHIKDVKVVWDIGANIGDHTRQYLDWGKKVVAFEPNPLAFTCLEHNCPEALCLPYAASDKDGSLNFTILNNVGASRISPSGEWSVEAKKLDDLDLPAPGFAKIDVEGWEPSVLRGMERVLFEHRPIVFVEINHEALRVAGFTHGDIFGFLWKLGYRNEPVFYPPKAGLSDLQLDCLFLP